MFKNLTKAEKSWVLYDVGNSAFTMLACSLIPIWFKALAIGADAVIIARPYVTAVYGAGAEGIRVLTQKLAAELEDTMEMCGAHTLKEITRDMVRL